MNAHDAYLESRILTADPVELIRVLYREATESVHQARQAMREGDIPRRTRYINRAMEILAELDSSLEQRSDNTIALNLAALYDYMQRRILEAHFQQAEPPLAEVSELLTTLLDGWENCQPEATASSASGDGTPQPKDDDEELCSSYAALSCSY